MLICPECQSENPESNKFCQHCGHSLTRAFCDSCGTSVGERLKAFVVTKQPAPKELELASNLATYQGKNKSANTAESSSGKSSWKLDRQYLDFQQRYYLSDRSEQKLSSVFANASSELIVQTFVRDRSPFKSSYLKALKKQKKQEFAELERELSNFYLLVTEYWNDLGVPTIALPYLILETYTPIIPSIYDAWQDESYGTLLLADRSHWKLLTTLWCDEEVPNEQILWSLNEMLKLWHPLVNTGCATSLLIKENLRLDEDESFGFEQLYFDSAKEPPGLKDLVAKWHEWLSLAPKKYTAELEAILQKAIAGSLNTVRELQEALYTLVTSDDEFSEESEENRESSLRLVEDEIDDLFDSEEIADRPTDLSEMEIASVTEASCTDIGSQRNHNEDFFGTRTTITKEEHPGKKTVNVRGLYIVCDGMGGHSAGEVASAMAVETLSSYFYAYWQDELPAAEVIEEGILLANRTIYQTNINNERSGQGMMGTTLVMALLQDTKLAIAHVGDSRIYRITRSSGLEQLTQDHEVGQREINRGVEPEIAYGRPDAYQLTQAIGPRENRYIKPAIELLDIQEDCLILLCSDGLCDNDFVEKYWETALKPMISSTSDLQTGLFELVDSADRYNGHDNITGILLRIKLQPNFKTSV